MRVKKRSILTDIYLHFLNLSRFILLPLYHKHRKIIRISMKRPTRLNSIKNMSSLILKYSQKNRISMELLFDEFKREIIQFGKIGMFVLDEASKKNLLYALVRANYNPHKGFNDRFLDAIFVEEYDHRIARFLIIKSLRLGDYERANMLLNPLPVDPWTQYNHLKLKRRVAAKIFSNSIYKSLFRKRDTLLSSNSPPHHFHMTSDESTDLFVIGQLEGEIPSFYNEVLVSYSYYDSKGELIESFPNEPKKGVSKSKTIGYYSYLRNNEDGFFFLITTLPEGCKYVHLEFKNWRNPDDRITHIATCYTLDFTKETCRDVADELLEHSSRWYEGVNWDNYRIEVYTKISRVLANRLSMDTGSLWLMDAVRAEQSHSNENRGYLEKLAKVATGMSIIYQWPDNRDSIFDRLNALFELESYSNLPLLLNEMMSVGVQHSTRENAQNMLQYANKLLLESSNKDIDVLLIKSSLELKMGDIQKSYNTLEGYNHESRVRRKLEVISEQLDLLKNEPNFNHPQIKPYKPTSSIAYLLHNSLPYHSGGYACRSHGLLSNLIVHGVDIKPLTRHCYPWDFKGFENAKILESEFVSGVQYYRSQNTGESLSKNGLKSYLNYYVKAVMEFSNKHSIGLIHAASNYRNGVAAVFAARSLNVPSIYEVRGFWEITRISREPEWKHSEHFQLQVKMETLACKYSDHVITLNESMKNELVTRGIQPEKITIIQNGVDTEVFSPLDPNEHLLDSLNLHKKFLIGYIGSIVDYEGLDILLEAMGLLRNKHPNIHALIVGDGTEMENLISRVSYLNLQESVTFTGRVPHESVNDYYSIIDVMVFPRRGLPVTELVTPLKPFEAMAMGKCVICSDVNALKEFIINGNNGVLFEKDNVVDLAGKMDEVIRSNSAKKIGIDAREWVLEHRDWSKISGDLKRLYERIMLAH